MKIYCHHCHQTVEIGIDRMRTATACPACGQPLDAKRASGEIAGTGGLFGWLSRSLAFSASMLIHAILAVLLALFYFDVLPVPGNSEVSIAPALAEPVEVTQPQVEVLQVAPVTLAAQTQSAFQNRAAVNGGGIASVDPPLRQLESQLTFDLGAEKIEFASDAGGAQVEFLGARGEGRYLCVVADHSGSMEGQKLIDLKREIEKILDEMGEDAVCKIVFFDDAVKLYAGGAWRNPGRDRAAISQFVSSITADGGTSPYPALEQVFNAGRKPDVLWFMTDGEYSPGMADGIKTLLNRDSPKTIINTCSFHGGGNADLQQIAQDSGGRYTEIP